jgi:hypothetical protein
MYGGKLMFGQHDDQVMSDINDSSLTSPSHSSAAANDPTELTNSMPDQPTQDSIPSENSDDLLDIKQHALSQLSPLVSHLDQSPEERFHTLMMMIQASDNQHLIKSAYDTALQISDDKQKAQALLDIVNEINYFTHPQNAN